MFYNDVMSSTQQLVVFYKYYQFFIAKPDFSLCYNLFEKTVKLFNWRRNIKIIRVFILKVIRLVSLSVLKTMCIYFDICFDKSLYYNVSNGDRG